VATGYVEQKFESIPGNETNSPTLSTKVLTAPFLEFEPQLNPSPMNRDDENRNTDEPVPVLEEAHDPSWRGAARMYPDVLAFWLKGMLGAPTTTAGNGIITDPGATIIPVGATRHVWTAPFGPSGASPMTQQLQVAYKDQSTFFKLKGAATESLSISSPESGGARIAVAGPAAYMERISDPSVTPSYEALTVRPFTRAGLTLTWLTGSATTEDFDLSFAQAIALVRSLGIASKFPDVVEKDEGPVVVSGSIAKRQLDLDDYDAMKAATGFSATAKWVSDTVIASSYPYKVFVEMPNCQYVGGELDALMNKRRHGARFNFKATRNSSASCTITVVNATTSYA
jgi:hypothetical protein